MGSRTFSLCREAAMMLPSCNEEPLLPYIISGMGIGRKFFTTIIYD